MKILYLTHRVPFPPYGGNKVRTLNHLRHLSKAHDVTLLSLAARGDDLQPETALKDLCQTISIVEIRRSASLGRTAAALPCGRSMSAAHFEEPAFREAIEGATANTTFDLLWANTSALTTSLEGVRAKRVIIDFSDVDSEKWHEYGRRLGAPRSWIYHSEARALQRLERRACRLADVVTMVSQEEVDVLRAIAPNATIRALPMGIDTDFFQPAETAQRRGRILFTGALDYEPNTEGALFFAREVLPLLHHDHPDATFAVVGSNPSLRFRRALRDLSDRVEVAGSVPDVRPYFAESEVYVAPLQLGRGVRVKILEAMAMGTPVVASRLAMRGIEGREGHDHLLAENPEEMSQSVGRLLDDPALRRSLANNGLRLVRELYSLAAMGRNVDRLVRGQLPYTE